MSGRPRDREINWPVVAGAIFTIFLSGAVLAPFFFVPTETSNWLQNLGNLGQLISGVFAPLAFVWVVVAVFLQSRELKLQREELMLTRDEMKNTRDVFELQKKEMERAANENREQTLIMTENLRNEGERQVYNEVDIVLYSLAAYMAANWKRAYVGNRYIINLEQIEGSLNRDNSDRVYTLARNALEQFVRHQQQQSPITEECVAFLDHCRNQISLLCETERFTKNRLASARIESLGLRPILGLLRSIKPA